MKIIGMNGPPRCGKDSIGNMLATILEDTRQIQPFIAALSMPMRETAYALLGEQYSLTHYERQKDVEHPLFHTTIRNVMIALSETFVKPTYGKDFWARRLAPAIDHWEGEPITIITDIGFQEEVDFLVNRYGCDNVIIVHVYRPGTDWLNDSRSYVHGSHQFMSISNESTLEVAAQAILAQLICQFGWEF